MDPLQSDQTKSALTNHLIFSLSLPEIRFCLDEKKSKPLLFQAEGKALDLPP